MESKILPYHLRMELLTRVRNGEVLELVFTQMVSWKPW